MEEKKEFCEKIRQYEASMYAFAYSIVQNEQDAQDVLGEAILRAYSGLETLKSKSSFKPWIFRIVHNVAIEMIRKKKKIVNVELDEGREFAAEETDITTRLVLRDSINRLKEPYHTVIWLYYFEDMSVIHIARILQTSPITVRKQLSRARKMLKEILDKEDFLR